jgi:predicted AAA+ superfamily ATPase
MFSRLINLPFKKNSLFLFGPRQVGKSTLVQHLLSVEEHLEINLLKNDILLKYKANPSQIRAECEFQLKEKMKFYVFIDEIQKCPELLNEVHYLIEKYDKKILFVLTGSSARKLKKASVNMLAGRAWQYYLYPFTHVELG